MRMSLAVFPLLSRVGNIRLCDIGEFNYFAGVPGSEVHKIFRVFHVVIFNPLDPDIILRAEVRVIDYTSEHKVVSFPDEGIERLNLCVKFCPCHNREERRLGVIYPVEVFDLLLEEKAGV